MLHLWPDLAMPACNQIVLNGMLFEINEYNSA